MYKGYEELKQTILDNINIAIDKREGSFTNNMISPVAYEMSNILFKMQDILNLGFIQTTFDEYLDKRISEFGLKRKEGIKTKGLIEVIGDEGLNIKSGTTLKYGDLEYTLLDNIILPTVNTGFVEATEIGSIYNIPKETEISTIKPINGLTKIIVKDGFENGTDKETDNEYRERFEIYISNNITSGNKEHYRHWALQVEGVGNAKVYPLWNGNGTVKVLIATADNLPTTEEIRKNCFDYISSVMPIGCQLTVTNVIPFNLQINSSIKLEFGYDINTITNTFKQRAFEYLKETEGNIYYSKLFSLLGELEGVEYIVDFTVNEAKENITLTEEQVGRITEVTISEIIQ